MESIRLPIITTALSLALALTTPTFAQEKTDEAKTTKAVSIAITLKTTDMSVGFGFLDQFDPTVDLPDITDKQHYVLVLSSDGKVKQSVGVGNPGFLQAQIHPAALMELFADQIDEHWDNVSGAAIIGMTQVGFTTKSAAQVMKALRVFPNQIATLDLGMSSHPMNELNGLVVSVKVKATQGSWLARLTKRLRPHSQGAPKIDAKKPLMNAMIGLDPEGLTEIFAPFLEVAAGLGAKNKKEREANLDRFTKVSAMVDWTYSMAGDLFGLDGYRAISGMRDAKGYAKMLHSAAFEEFMKVAKRMSPMMETEFEPVDFKHGDVPVAKTIITTEIDTPGRPAGDQIIYAAVAGGYAVQTASLGKDAIEKLIDTAQNQGIKRAPIPNGLLGFIEFQFMKLLDQVAPFGNPLDGDENAPKTMRLEFSTLGGTLNGVIKFL